MLPIDRWEEWVVDVSDLIDIAVKCNFRIEEKEHAIKVTKFFKVVVFEGCDRYILARRYVLENGGF